MKTLKSIAVLASALVAHAAVSCTKEETPSAEQENGINTITLSIEQPTAEDATKTALGGKSGDYYPIDWSTGDAIAVSGQSATEFKQYTLQSGDGTQSGTFSGESVEGAVYAYYPYANVTSVSKGTYTVTIPDEQQYVADSFGDGAMPMYAGASGTGELHSMTPLMSVLKISLTGSCNVKSILLQSASVNLSGAATVNMANGEVTFTTGKKYVLLTCGAGVQLNGAATAFHIVVPATAAAVTDFTVTIKDDKGYLMQKKLSTSNKFAAKVIKNVGTELPVTTSCILPGKFTVNSGSKQVQFTSGNLWCNTSSPVTYNFESAQNVTYSTLGLSSYTASHVCHFNWSKTASVAYAETYSDDGRAIEDAFWCGEDNKLTVDGQSGLYALTGGDSGEWNYLFNSRTNASDLYRIGVSVTIGDKTVENCVVISPDACLGGYTFNRAKISYTASEWATAEASGLVCLPTAGRRSGSNLYNAGSGGSYWSASPDGSNVRGAYRLHFSGNGVLPSNFGTRSNGCSVRLVSAAR